MVDNALYERPPNITEGADHKRRHQSRWMRVGLPKDDPINIITLLSKSDDEGGGGKGVKNLLNLLRLLRTDPNVTD